MLIKLSLQEKQKLRSHFSLPWSRSLLLSEQLGEFHITSVPQALGGSDPNEHTPSSLRGPGGCNDLIATAIGHSGQFHGRYLFFGLDAERIFFPLLLSPWKPQLHCWLSPFPPHAFQINIGSWLPTGCPQPMGAELCAEGIGTRVKPGTGGMVTEGDEEGVQGPLASLFTHSWKLIL